MPPKRYQQVESFARSKQKDCPIIFCGWEHKQSESAKKKRKLNTKKNENPSKASSVISFAKSSYDNYDTSSDESKKSLNKTSLVKNTGPIVKLEKTDENLTIRDRIKN